MTSWRSSTGTPAISSFGSGRGAAGLDCGLDRRLPLACHPLPRCRSSDARAGARRRAVTRYLVDTDVVSATSHTIAVKRSELIEWMDLHSSDLFLSAVTIAEIADGIAKAKREGAKRKATNLSAWLRTVLHLYGDRVLPFDVSTAEIAGALADSARGRGYAPSFADIATAATARRHELTILSRNTRHFAPLDVAVADPFQNLQIGK